MDEIVLQHEAKLAKLYIATTCEALAFELALVGIIFFYMGVTSFSVLQAIGTTLLILLLGSLSLQIRKKNIKKSILQKLSEQNLSETELTKFLTANPTEYEFVYALFISPKSIKKAELPPTP